MSDDRFDPMKELNKLSKTVGKAIEQGISTVQTTVQSATSLGAGIRVDVYEADNEVVVMTNALDGVVGGSIEVSMEGNILTIKGETQPDEIPAQASILIQERRFGIFEKAITIPIPVKSDQANATLKKTGVLIVKLPVDQVKYQDITVTPAE